MSLNGIFEAVCIIGVFPIIVWLGASGATTDNTSRRICRFLGDISFPLYIVHYPLMYAFYMWLIKTELNG
ncbi:acyltransferase family protein [Prevotella sp.]|uniref:acyltransferase family protein n=1 Tax=Prevotella sp. TaxID=59823 RepID=UPI0025DD8AA1|nr:acyltransferase family protein [Prevotella sp.]